MNKLLIKDIIIINEGLRSPSDIYIEGEFIKKIGNNIKLDNDVKIIDGKGHLAIPGMIDDQVHFREPGIHIISPPIFWSSIAAILSNLGMSSP